ncbi:hypothetical protein C8J57DRAFT_1727168 [Mycena rebaudengoi]|nr:hypothetical protein C8J57DRAFT_1727168 [Mycena rebaudengoi]
MLPIPLHPKLAPVLCLILVYWLSNHSPHSLQPFSRIGHEEDFEYELQIDSTSAEVPSRSTADASHAIDVPGALLCSHAACARCDHEVGARVLRLLVAPHHAQSAISALAPAHDANLTIQPLSTGLSVTILGVIRIPHPRARYSPTVSTRLTSMCSAFVQMHGRR